MGPGAARWRSDLTLSNHESGVLQRNDFEFIPLQSPDIGCLEHRQTAPVCSFDLGEAMTE